MHINKRVKLAVIAMILVISIGTLFYKVSSKPITEEKWLKENSTSINLKNDDDFSGFELLKDDLDKHDVFFTGEMHGVGINDELHFKFLKYFVKKAKVKNFLIEHSPCEGYFLNKYIQTGNIEFLNKFSRNVNCSKEQYEKWKGIYKFNSILNKKDKIQVIGIDISDSDETYYYFLSSILDKYKIPKEISKDIQSFKNLKSKMQNSSYEQMANLVGDYKKSVENNSDLYKNFLNKDFKIFEYVLDNFYYCTKWNNITLKSEEFFKYREEKMYDNLKKIYSNLPKGKYYGHFGNDHILQKGNNLAAFINENNKLKNKVLSIRTLYENSFSLYFCKGEYIPVDLPKLNAKLTALLNPLNNSNQVLFKITGEKSPFSKIKDSKYFQLDMKEDKKPLEKYCVKDYSQYFLLIRKAKPVTPMK
ncbi:hypothetical protein ACFIJ5_18005 (plasmid) [Haloimpatiens sp. FM7330]|uniref:hypothetical protein n=1 Tax=Haloimpatiens sp. FM7330 TaxID=3298610 RepID=UPI003628375E